MVMFSRKPGYNLALKVTEHVILIISYLYHGDRMNKEDYVPRAASKKIPSIQKLFRLLYDTYLFSLTLTSLEFL